MKTIEIVGPIYSMTNDGAAVAVACFVFIITIITSTC